AGVDAARLEAAGEPVQELAGARVDERPPRDEAGGADELVDRGGAEEPLQLVRHLTSQPLGDLAAELVERVELGGRAGEVVVERRQDALAHPLDDDVRLAAAAVGQLVGDLAALTGREAAHTVLDLLDEPLRAELDDVVALRVPVAGFEVEDD